MDCPRCGAHNETDVGSCLSCGASMSEDESLPTIAQKPTAAAPGKGGSPRLAQGAPPKQCPNCMTLNAATFKFCARCGTPLGATSSPHAAPPVPAAARTATPAAKASAATKSAAAPAGARPAAAKAAAPTPKAPSPAATRP